MGGGALSDYGRALWSAEIASRQFYSDSMGDEDIAAKSGFLGSTELPYWLRPSAKFRGLELEMNPGSSSQTSKFYNMQAEAGVAVQDKDAKYLASITYGYVIPPSEYGAGRSQIDRFLASEYYFRSEVFKNWWVYAGLLEKVFGLRNIDHSSYQRTYQGFNPNNNTTDGTSHSQGVIVHKVEEKWEVAANAFFGNPYDDNQYKQKGFSLWSEFEVGENKRLGASVMTEKSDVLEKQLAAVHYRQQVSKGSALLFEWGLIDDKAPSTDHKRGSYNLFETLVSLARGYNLKATVERYNREFNSTQPEQWKWSAGFLVFPAPRFELRAEVVNERYFSSQQAQDDVWALEGQIHVSL